MDTARKQEHFYVRVSLVKGEGPAAWHATLYTGTPGHAFVPAYEVTRSGDAQRAHDAAVNGFYIDHHGRFFRDGTEGIECECPE